MREWNPRDTDTEAAGYELGADPKRDALNAELYWAWKKFDQRCREHDIVSGTREHNYHQASYSAYLRKKLGIDKVNAEASYLAARESWDEAHTPAPPCAVNR